MQQCMQQMCKSKLYTSTVSFNKDMKDEFPVLRHQHKQFPDCKLKRYEYLITCYAFIYLPMLAMFCVGMPFLYCCNFLNA